MPSPTLISFSVESAKDDTGEDHHIAGLTVKNGPGFLDFIRNSDYGLNPMEHSDAELAHLFVYQYCQRWLAENLSKPMFVESHGFPTHGEIRYDRAWNPAFINSVKQLPFEVLPSTEEELVDMYMNYVYGVRLMEELEAAAEAQPQSIAHPQLSDPNNTLKG